LASDFLEESRRSYLIDALRADDGLDAEPKHVDKKETDDAKIAEPETE
jgi:hypothetical protein